MPERAELQAEWANMLAHQLPALPPLATFWEDLEGFFAWLSGRPEAVELSPIPGAATAAPAPGLAVATPPALRGSLEAIRFAAANRLCAEIIYRDGRSRIIEPYSLRTTSDGNLLLFAVKHLTGELRSYRLDRITRARATETAFRPRYHVELTAAGLLSAPTTRRTRSPGPLTGSRARRGTSGPTYIIECRRCGKSFKRSTRSTALRKHKDPHGAPCPGRTGYLVDTRY